MTKLFVQNVKYCLILQILKKSKSQMQFLTLCHLIKDAINYFDR